MQIRTAPRFRAVLVGALSGALLQAIPCARPATAGAITWDNPLGGTFADGANWAGGMAPTADDDALFDLDDIYTVLFDSDASTRSLAVSRGDVTFDLQGFTYDWAPTKTDGAFRVGNNSAENASLTFTNGEFDVPIRLSLPGIIIGSTGGGFAELIVDNATLNFTESFISAGGFAGAGKLTVRNGGRITDIGPPTSFGSIGIGDEAEVTGPGSAIIARSLSVGGTLQINRASASAETWTIDGLVTVDNGSLFVERFMRGAGRIEVRNGGYAENGGDPANTVAEIDVRGMGSEYTFRSTGVFSSGDSHYTVADGGVIGDGYMENVHLTVLAGGGTRQIFEFREGGVLRVESSGVATLGALSRNETDILELALDDASLLSPAMIEVGFASLGGALSLELLPDFTPTFGDRFKLLSGSFLEGEFDTIDLPTLPSGLAFEIERSMTTVSAVVVPAPASALILLTGCGLPSRRRRPTHSAKSKP